MGIIQRIGKIARKNTLVIGCAIVVVGSHFGWTWLQDQKELVLDSRPPPWRRVREEYYSAVGLCTKDVIVP